MPKAPATSRAGTGARAAARAAAEGKPSKSPKGTAPKKKVWQEVEEAESRKIANRARAANRRRRQLAVVYDIEGPKVRLGILWFLVVLTALYAGRWPFALLYAVFAAMGGLQCARAWRRRRSPANPVVAALAAAGMTLAAALSTAALGLAILAAVGLSVVATLATANPLVTAAHTLQSGLWVGAAGAGLATAYRYHWSVALGLVLVVSAYEIGDFIVGSGARNAIEGPVAGAAAVLVVQFSISVLGLLEPFTISNGWIFAILAAVLCPLGQLAASLVLPSVRAKAPAVRRLDSLILLAPVWAYAAGVALTNRPR